MNTLTLRPYLGEADLVAIVDLVNACEAVDKLEQGTSIAELQLEFDEPTFLPERDLRLWESSDGRLIGIAQLWVPEVGKDQFVSVWFKVHPTMRGNGIEADIIAWAEAQTRQISQERGVPGKLHASSRSNQPDKIDLLSNSGFSEVRYFFCMERSLHDPIPEPQFPSGFSLRSMREAELEAWVEMFNQTFVDHWNHRDATVEDFSYWFTLPDYRAELNLLAIAPDGSFAAFCYGEIDPARIDRIGRQEGGINLLGTRRPFRRLGLARAMLLAGLHRLKASGMETARLGVDVDNPSGAKRLYESVGFQPVFTNIVFEKAM